MPNKLRILQIIPTLDRSGAEKQMVALAKGLPRDRFEVEVVALARLGPFEAELRSAGIPVALEKKRWKFDPLCISALARRIRKGGFDIVQTWIFAANVHGRLAAFRARTPAVIATEMAVDLWKSRVHLAIDRRLARRTDAVVGNSQAVVEFYRSAGVRADRLVMIHSGIACESAARVESREAIRAPLGVSASDPLILFAGRLAEQKRVADLLFALDLLQHVRDDVKTWIVGSGPLERELKERARAHRLEAKVSFLGHRADVPRLLSAADVCVLPSAYEGLPNIVLEAMCSEVPVVATAAPGTTELIEDGVSGLLVPVGKPAELTRAMRKIILDPELGRRLAGAAKARVTAEFSAAKMAAEFAALYERLAEAKRQRVS